MTLVHSPKLAELKVNLAATDHLCLEDAKSQSLCAISVEVCMTRNHEEYLQPLYSVQVCKSTFEKFSQRRLFSYRTLWVLLVK
jgi:hypothetical protein